MTDADTIYHADEIKSAIIAQPSLLKHIDQRARVVMELRLGVGEHDTAYTLDDCRRILKITKERVRQIEERAIRIIGGVVARERDDLWRLVHAIQDAITRDGRAKLDLETGRVDQNINGLPVLAKLRKLADEIDQEHGKGSSPAP